MFSCRIYGVVSIAILSTLLPGCASSDFKARLAGRWGPDPALPASEVSTVITNQTQVLAYIIQDAGLASINAQGMYDRNSVDWFQVAEWGFNVGRQDCEVYLNNLFRMNREKQRNDSMLVAIGTAAAAFLTSTTSSQKALSIVAAAFGMSTALNDALFQSFLFTEAPGLVANKVKELQDTYQETMEKNQNDSKLGNKINTAHAAYNAIQNYYHICLPQSIEGTLLQAVANTAAKTSDPGKPVPSGTGALSTSKNPTVSLAPVK